MGSSPDNVDACVYQYQDYAYQADGRLNYSGVYADNLPAQAKGFGYGYLPNFHLVNQLS